MSIKLKKSCFPRRISIVDFFEWIIAIVSIIDFNTIWLYMDNTPSYKNILMSGILLGSVLIAVLFRKNRRYLKQAISSSFCILFLIIIFAVIHPIRLDGVFRMGISAAACVFYCRFSKKENGIPSFIFKIEKLIFAITVVSLFFWFFGSLLHVIQPTHYVHEVWTGIGRFQGALSPSYFGLYYSTQKEYIFGILIERNTAIFAEAPMASIMFTIALLIDYSLKEEPSKYRPYIYSIAILSTASTTGILGLGVFWIMVLSTDNRTKTILFKLLKYIGVPILLIGGTIVGGALLQDKLISVSGINRLADWIYGFQGWLIKPFFGYGYSEDILDALATRLGVKMIGYNNSITPVLINGGLFLLFPYIYAFSKARVYAISKQKKKLLIFTIVYFFEFLVTISSYKFMTFIILAAMCSFNSMDKEKYLK